MRIFRKVKIREYLTYDNTMLKDAAGVAGGALLCTPLIGPAILHGLAGFLIGGAGLIIADSLIKEIANQMSNVQMPDAGPGDTQKEEDVPAASPGNEPAL